MTQNESKDLLRTCMEHIDPNINVDDLICYKFGTREASQYQHNEILVRLRRKDKEIIGNGATHVVDCFLHPEIYVAWKEEIGRGAEKYVVYRNDLVEMEKDSKSIYKEVRIGKNKDLRAFIFRGKEGVEKFIKEQLISK